MANKIAAPLPLRVGDRERLETMTRSTTLPAGLVMRARLVLLASDGVGNQAIADRVGTSRPTVNLWRGRYAQRGIAGLSDQPRPGRPRSVDRAALGIEHSTVAAIWAEYGVKPWKAETFKFSTDPQLAGKVTDVVGLYLNPPENAIVLCIDEKSQIQALDRTQKLLPMQIGHPEQRTHDYRRHGTATLFAALEIATGKVTGLTKNRHRHQEFLVFLKHVARAYPDAELHLVMDNYATHKHARVKEWLADNPRIHVHFTPTSGSWLNLVEVWFGIIERQAIHRGTFSSVRDLMTKIRAFITGWNDRSHPFTWTKPADEILASIDRKRKHVSATDH